MTAAFVRLYGNDWFTGCAALKADERGVYISMCVHIWTTGQRVPLDDAEAARRLCLQFNLYQRVRNSLLEKGKIKRHADGYGNDRAESELAKASDARSEAVSNISSRPRADAAAGTPRRAEQHATGGTVQSGAPADIVARPTPDEVAASDSALLGSLAGAMPGAPIGALPCSPLGSPLGTMAGDRQKYQRNQDPFIEPEPEPREEIKSAPRARTPRGARLENDWIPSDDLRQWTRATFPQSTAESLEREVENFRDYWTAKPGAAACKLDWDATWRVWCRRAFVAAPLRPRAGSAGQAPWIEERNARVRKLAEHFGVEV